MRYDRLLIIVAVLSLVILAGCSQGIVPSDSGPTSVPSTAVPVAETEELDLTSPPPSATQTSGREVVATSPPAPTQTKSDAPDDDMTESPTPTSADPAFEKLLKLSKEDLARRFELDVDQIQLLAHEMVEWGDSSLGCPQPGMMYAQVVTPGYRFLLEAGGNQYSYHTDMGQTVLLCE